MSEISPIAARVELLQNELLQNNRLKVTEEQKAWIVVIHNEIYKAGFAIEAAAPVGQYDVGRAVAAVDALQAAVVGFTTSALLASKTAI